MGYSGAQTDFSPITSFLANEKHIVEKSIPSALKEESDPRDRLKRFNRKTLGDLKFFQIQDKVIAIFIEREYDVLRTINKLNT